MKESKEVTYKELHLPASSLVSFMQSIYSQRRVGTLTVCFGTGGVPTGMLVWKERLDSPLVDSTCAEPCTYTNIPI